MKAPYTESKHTAFTMHPMEGSQNTPERWSFFRFANACNAGGKLRKRVKSAGGFFRNQTGISG